jgi:OOP family OmpA-OmpF porin
VVTGSDRHEGRFHVTGLRDPFARDTKELLRGSGLDPAKVVTTWAPFQSLAPAFVLKRAAAVLSPPDTVSLALQDDVLRASGSAPHAWIRATRIRGPLVAGISAVDTSEIQASEAIEAEDLVRRIEAAVIFFEVGSAQLAPDQADSLNRVARDILRLQALARLLDQPLSIDLMGHTDPSGTKSGNQALSRQRAAAIQTDLVLRGVQSSLLTPVGAAARPPLQPDDAPEAPALKRSVTFHVNLALPPVL